MARTHVARSKFLFRACLRLRGQAFFGDSRHALNRNLERATLQGAGGVLWVVSGENVKEVNKLDKAIVKHVFSDEI